MFSVKVLIECISKIYHYVIIEDRFLEASSLSPIAKTKPSFKIRIVENPSDFLY